MVKFVARGSRKQFGPWDKLSEETCCRHEMKRDLDRRGNVYMKSRFEPFLKRLVDLDLERFKWPL